MIKRHLAPISYLKEVLPGIYLLELKLKTEVSPGQFFMFSCGKENFLRRPLAMARKTPQGIAFLFKIVGSGTTWLSQRKIGEELDVLGPFGQGFTLPEKPENILLIAGGMGIAPLIFLAEEATVLGHKVALIIGAKTKSEIIPQELLPEKVEKLWTTEDGSFGYKGKATELVKQLRDVFAKHYASGPEGMYEELARILGDKEVEVSLEVRMGCGFGACLGCSIPTVQGNKLVCRDGPVFKLKSLLL